LGVKRISNYFNKFYYYECGRSRQGLGCSYKRISGPVFDKAEIETLNEEIKKLEGEKI